MPSLKQKIHYFLEFEKRWQRKLVESKKQAGNAKRVNSGSGGVSRGGSSHSWRKPHRSMQGALLLRIYARKGEPNRPVRLSVRVPVLEKLAVELVY